MRFKAARYVNMALATWLLFSAFLWPHTRADFLAPTLVGLVVVLAAPFAIGAPNVRYVNTVMGLLLAASAFVLPRLTFATAWNDAVVGLAIAAVSLLGPHHARRLPIDISPSSTHS
jgi:hypothetical protein